MGSSVPPASGLPSQQTLHTASYQNQPPTVNSVASSTPPDGNPASAETSPDPLFLTDAFDASISQWETYFLVKLASHLHAAIAYEFIESREQSVFHFFVAEDTNLNGHIDTEDLQAGSRIDFVPLLKWYNNEVQNPHSPIQEGPG